jgi:hypothetical protein
VGSRSWVDAKEQDEAKRAHFAGADLSSKSW